jgi:RsiW-degrading membrane proteinase PrsW (M82 family)
VKLYQARKIAQHVAPNAHRFAKHVVPQVVKPARVVWNQVIGTLFICFAVPALFKAVQFYRSLNTEPANLARLVWALIFGIPMLLLGINSFMRARKISRS